MNRSTWSKLALLALASGVAVVACGDDTKGGSGGAAGQSEGGDGNSVGGSSAGKGGSNTAGKAGSSAGNGGSAGSAGKGGNAGSMSQAGEGGGSVVGVAGEAPGGSSNAGGEGGAPNVPGAGGYSNGSGGVGGYPGGCDIEKDYGSLGAVEGEAKVPQGGGIINYTTLLDNGALPDQLQIQLYDKVGVFTGAVAPGVYELQGDELNFQTCGLCVRILEDAVTDIDYRGAYMATGGTVTITQVSPKLVGSVKNLTFEHVTIDNLSSLSTPVGDDCGTHIKSLSFDSTVQ